MRRVNLTGRRIRLLRLSVTRFCLGRVGRLPVVLFLELQVWALALLVCRLSDVPYFESN